MTRVRTKGRCLMDINSNAKTMSAAPRPAALRPAALRMAESGGAFWSTATATATAIPQIARDHAASFVAPHSLTARNDVKQAPPPRGVPR